MIDCLLKCKFIFAVLFSGFFSLNAYAENEAVVYFFPLSAQTYHPITRLDIVREASEVWNITSDDQVLILRKILTSGEVGEFDESVVRVAAIIGDDTFFVDTDGVVVEKDVPAGIKIDRIALIRFRDSLGIGQRKILRKTQ